LQHHVRIGGPAFDPAVIQTYNTRVKHLSIVTVFHKKIHSAIPNVDNTEMQVPNCNYRLPAESKHMIEVFKPVRLHGL